MNKKTIIMSYVALFMTLGMSQSVMAKQISYMGYQYSGKINKENIPEGKGTITMSVQDIIDKSKTIDFSISGIFNGSNVTNAYFSTTWLSYKGDMEIKEGNSFVLKKGGVITTNAYRFSFSVTTEIDPNRIEHYDITLTEDKQMNYSELTQISMPSYTMPFPAPRKLNPPSEMTLYINPSINKVLVQQTGLSVPSEIVYYNISRRDAWMSLKGSTEGSDFTYKDSEGRTWKFNENMELLAVEYPDGSICKKEFNFERVSGQYVPKLRRMPNSSTESYIALDEQKEIYMRIPYISNWNSYFAGRDSLLIIDGSDEIKIDLVNLSTYDVRESAIDKIENFDNVIKEYLLSNISIPNNRELSIFCVSDENITKKVKVFSVKNGVVSGRKETAAAEKKAQQAKAAKEQAAYNQLCKQYGKKYADAAVNGRIIVGMPEELMKKLYYCVLRYQSASRKKYDSADARAIIWVTNGRVSSISYY